jgi:hypothetical protein
MERNALVRLKRLKLSSAWETGQSHRRGFNPRAAKAQSRLPEVAPSVSAFDKNSLPAAMWRWVSLSLPISLGRFAAMRRKAETLIVSGEAFWQ